MIAIQNAEDIEQLIGCRIVGAEWQEHSPSITFIIENHEEQQQAITLSAQANTVVGGGGLNVISVLNVLTHPPK